MISTAIKFERRRKRVRAKISGTTDCPRLTVKVSNRHLTAQIIDDTKGVTLAYATTVKAKTKGNMTDQAAWVGHTIGALATKQKIKKVVFDRSGKLYHGRLHALAEAARSEGLSF